MCYIGKGKQNITKVLKKIIFSCSKTIIDFKKRYFWKKFYLADVKFLDNSKIVLIVIIQGVRKHIEEFTPEDIVNDDDFLSGFSCCDVRTITYLAFYSSLAINAYEVSIKKQIIEKGKTYFELFDAIKQKRVLISAKELYRNYELLTKLCKKDMITAISTAVQEQTIFDLYSLNQG